MSYEDRKFPRYNFELKVKVETPEDETFVMKTINISEQGLKLISQEKYVIIEPQSIVSIVIGNEELIVKGEVRHYSNEDSGHTVFGIMISAEESEWKEYFSNIVKKHNPKSED